VAMMQTNRLVDARVGGGCTAKVQEPSKSTTTPTTGAAPAVSTVVLDGTSLFFKSGALRECVKEDNRSIWFMGIRWVLKGGNWLGKVVPALVINMKSRDPEICSLFEDGREGPPKHKICFSLLFTYSLLICAHRGHDEPPGFPGGFKNENTMLRDTELKTKQDIIGTVAGFDQVQITCVAAFVWDFEPALGEYLVL